VTVVDDHAGTVLTLASLAPSASANYSGSYVPISSPSTDTVIASGTDAINDGAPVTATASATCKVNVPLGCALSPGYWKGSAAHKALWDSATDPIAIAAGFYGGLTFPKDALTYLQVMQSPKVGDVTIQLGFKYIAARLNVADGLTVPLGLPALLDQILTPSGDGSTCSGGYLCTNPVGSNPKGSAKATGQALLAQIDDYFSSVGEKGCPSG
jgi:hypothetical protein